MKPPLAFGFLCALLLAAHAQAQRGEQSKQKLQPSRPAPSLTPPPVASVGPPAPQAAPPATPAVTTTTATPATPAAPATAAEQKLYGHTGLLVTTEQAQAIVDRFKEAYPKLGSPRLLIYVNRQLATKNSASPQTAPDEPTAADSHMEIPLADRQTMRDLERLFGRPLRSAGASLADQNAANTILGGKSIHSLENKGDAAAKDREALSHVADAIIEVLISAKNLTVQELGGDRVYSVPDIQATAIRLRDFKILAQSTSNDILGRAVSAQRFDANEITEATALALMEDMATGTK